MTGDDRQNWLLDVFHEAAAQRLCVRWGCTTCCVGPFEALVYQGAAAARGVSLGPLPRSRAPFLGALATAGLTDTFIAALARLNDIELLQYREALVLLAAPSSLYLDSSGALVKPLVGTPFGEFVLARMWAAERAREEYASRQIRRSIEERENAEATRLRKQAEAEARRVAHRERLSAKAVRDAVWRQAQLDAGMELEAPDAVIARRERRRARRLAARGA